MVGILPLYWSSQQRAHQQQASFPEKWVAAGGRPAGRGLRVDCTHFPTFIFYFCLLLSFVLSPIERGVSSPALPLCSGRDHGRRTSSFEALVLVVVEA
jgi:hypothetical protein